MHHHHYLRLYAKTTHWRQCWKVIKLKNEYAGEAFLALWKGKCRKKIILGLNSWQQWKEICRRFHSTCMRDWDRHWRAAQFYSVNCGWYAFPPFSLPSSHVLWSGASLWNGGGMGQYVSFIGVSGKVSSANAFNVITTRFESSSMNKLKFLRYFFTNDALPMNILNCISAGDHWLKADGWALSGQVSTE